MLSRLWAVPAMVGAQTITTTTVTSTVMMPADLRDWSTGSTLIHWSHAILGIGFGPFRVPAAAASQYLPTLIGTVEVSRKA